MWESKDPEFHPRELDGMSVIRGNSGEGRFYGGRADTEEGLRRDLSTGKAVAIFLEFCQLFNFGQLGRMRLLIQSLPLLT